MAGPRSPIRRILVALDDSPSSRFAIRTAVHLAARFNAQIVGLFVEDINLLRVAQLAFVREIGQFSTTPRRLDIGDLKRQLRSQAERIRRALGRQADAHGIAWELRVKRGPVALEVMNSAAEVDLMIMGRAGRSFAAHGRLGTTMRSVVLQRPGLTFVLSTATAGLDPVMALYDGSAAGRRGLDIAGALTDDDAGLLVVLVADQRDASQALRNQAARYLGERAERADYRVALRPSLDGLAWRIRTWGSGLLVLPCGKPHLQGEQLCTLVQAVPNPILLVR